jgi:hypothetical protein
MTEDLEQMLRRGHKLWNERDPDALTASPSRMYQLRRSGVAHKQVFDLLV